MAQCSGAGLFLIAAKFCNFFTQLMGALGIAAGERNGQRKLQFFQLVLPLERVAGLRARSRSGD